MIQNLWLLLEWMLLLIDDEVLGLDDAELGSGVHLSPLAGLLLPGDLGRGFRYLRGIGHDDDVLQSMGWRRLVTSRKDANGKSKSVRVWQRPKDDPLDETHILNDF